MKLLILNKKFKKYDILDVAEEQTNAIIEKIKTEGLQCKPVVSEPEICKKMENTGYSREKYY